MSTRLYPDIITAAQINNYRRIYQLATGTVPEQIELTYNDLLLLQEDYKHFAITTNVFVGFEGKDWNEADYMAYFLKLPQYFKLQEGGCIVNIAALENEIENWMPNYPAATRDELFQVCLRVQLLTEGTYPQRIHQAIGLGGPLSM